MSPCCSTISFFIASLSGPIDSPSPMTSSVTPWRMSLCERPSSISDSLAQLSMLMKPGATARPRASISRPAARVVQLADRRDGVAVDRHVADERWPAAAVVDRAVADDEVTGVVHRGRSWRAAARRERGATGAKGQELANLWAHGFFSTEGRSPASEKAKRRPNFSHGLNPTRLVPERKDFDCGGSRIAMSLANACRGTKSAVPHCADHGTPILCRILKDTSNSRSAHLPATVSIESSCSRRVHRDTSRA